MVYLQLLPPSSHGVQEFNRGEGSLLAVAADDQKGGAVEGNGAETGKKYVFDAKKATLKTKVSRNPYFIISSSS